jgi:dGTPase
MKQTDLLPKQWRKDVAEVQDQTALARIVADYISGMTDRFALQEYDRLIKKPRDRLNSRKRG